MLTEIKKYLIERKQSTLDEICITLKYDKQMTAHALHLLEQKGYIKTVKTEMPCKSCTCGSGCLSEIYQYIGD